jgi:hypothetical protein
MFDEVFDACRKTAESSLRMQQEMFRHTLQQWPGASSHDNGVLEASARESTTRWIEFTTDSLNLQRESIEAMYKSAIQIFGQAMRLSEAKTPDAYRRMVENFWRTMFEAWKNQSEMNLRGFEKGLEKWSKLFPEAKA